MSHDKEAWKNSVLTTCEEPSYELIIRDENGERRYYAQFPPPIRRRRFAYWLKCNRQRIRTGAWALMILSAMGQISWCAWNLTHQRADLVPGSAAYQHLIDPR